MFAGTLERQMLSQRWKQKPVAGRGPYPSDCKCFPLRGAKDVLVLAEGVRNIIQKVSEQNKQNNSKQIFHATICFLEDKNVRSWAAIL